MWDNRKSIEFDNRRVAALLFLHFSQSTIPCALLFYIFDYEDIDKSSFRDRVVRYTIVL